MLQVSVGLGGMRPMLSAVASSTASALGLRVHDTGWGCPAAAPQQQGAKGRPRRWLTARQTPAKLPGHPGRSRRPSGAGHSRPHRRRSGQELPGQGGAGMAVSKVESRHTGTSSGLRVKPRDRLHNPSPWTSPRPGPLHRHRAGRDRGLLPAVAVAAAGRVGVVAGAGGSVLALFAWLLTLHPSAAGRVYAAAWGRLHRRGAGVAVGRGGPDPARDRLGGRGAVRRWGGGHRARYPPKSPLTSKSPPCRCSGSPTPPTSPTSSPT